MKNKEKGQVDVLYKKAGQERIHVFSGELGGKYESREGHMIQQVVVTDAETGDITVMNLREADIWRIQAKRMI